MLRTRSSLALLNGAVLILTGPFVAKAQELTPANSTIPATTTPTATPRALSLSDALDVARRGSFTIGSAQARIAAAQARLRAAVALPGTTLTLAHAFGKNTGGFDEDILLSQVIEFGKRGSSGVL